MNPVLESTQQIMERSKYIKINHDKAVEFAKSFTHEHIKHWLKEAPFDFSKLTDKEKLNFLLIFNSLSFCYWGDPKWTVDYQGKTYDRGSWCMLVALQRALDEKKPVLNAEFLANISKQEVEHLLRGNIPIPLLENRWKILREIGNILMQKCQGNFSSLVTEANNDAMELLRLIVATFPSFDDSTTFEGKKVFFYKRAQLLVSDICQVFDGKGYGKLKNINELTVCADYKIPEMLRKLGILSYVPELAAKIANKVLIPKDSKEEIEIRANTIWAVEIIKQEIQKKISDIDSMHIGDHIWLASGPIKIYHRTLTTCY